MSDCFHVGAIDQKIPFSLTDEILITFLVDLGARIFGAKLAVQGRYNVGVSSSDLTGSLQGIAERPLPCNYNVIQFVCALSRRRRGFKSRRGRQISSLEENCLLSV